MAGSARRRWKSHCSRGSPELRQRGSRDRRRSRYGTWSRVSAVAGASEIVRPRRVGARAGLRCRQQQWADRARARRGVDGSRWVASGRVGPRGPGDGSADVVGRGNRRRGCEVDAMPDRGVSRPRERSGRCDRGLEDRDERRRPHETRPLALESDDIREATELRVLRRARRGRITRPRREGVPGQRDGWRLGVAAAHRRRTCDRAFVSSRALSLARGVQTLRYSPR